MRPAAGTAAGKNKGLFRRTVPQFNAGLCTGCLECALACPDAAIPNAVHEVHTLVSTAVWSRYMRSSMLDVINQDFVRTARAKGVPERRILMTHVLRNALLPMMARTISDRLCG